MPDPPSRLGPTPLSAFYSRIINTVIAGLKSELESEGTYGVDEQATLASLKSGWEDKLTELRPANFAAPDHGYHPEHLLGYGARQQFPGRVPAGMYAPPPQQQQQQQQRRVPVPVIPPQTVAAPQHRYYYDESGNYVPGTSATLPGQPAQHGVQATLPYYPRPGAVVPVSHQSMAGVAQQGQHPLLMSRAPLIPVMAGARLNAAQLAQAALQQHKSRESLQMLETGASRVRRRESDGANDTALEETMRRNQEREERKRRRVDAAHNDDAINSDLDDTDDEGDAEKHHGGDASWDVNANTVLCVYEKVTRTKNKWRCTLKDGMIALGGKEYVFHRAQCDFEW